MPTSKYGPGDEPIPGSGYRLVSFLGRGGFGKVWKALAPGGTEVAVKIIRLGNRQGRKEFRALQLVKLIRHANLLPIHGFWLKAADGSVLSDSTVNAADRATAAITATATLLPEPSPHTPDELFIVMGLGDKSVFDRLEECRDQGLPGIPQEELLGYMQDCAEALDFLNRPVLDPNKARPAIQHCDIKPHNLLIVAGHVQIGDFGLARMQEDGRATSVAGSMAYAAPECLIENQPTLATDQYSLAITYYELKTGKLPFGKESLGAILEAKREAKLDFSGLPEAEQDVLRRQRSGIRPGVSPPAANWSRPCGPQRPARTSPATGRNTSFPGRSACWSWLPWREGPCMPDGGPGRTMPRRRAGKWSPRIPAWGVVRAWWRRAIRIRPATRPARDWSSRLPSSASHRT